MKPRICLSQPAADRFFTAPGKLFPESIHFILALAIHDKRDGFCKFELRAAVQSHKFLPVEPEGNRHHRSLALSGDFGTRFSIMRHAEDF